MPPPPLSLPRSEQAARHFAVLARDGARSMIRPVALALAALYAVLSLAHLLILEGGRGPFMSMWALTSAVFFLGVALAYETRWVRKRPHQVLAAFSFVALSNALLHLAMEGDPTQTTNVALVLLGVGALVFHGPTLFTTLGAGLAGWIGVGAYWQYADPYWVHYGFAMVSTSVLAALVFQGRIHFIAKAAELEWEGRRREASLKASQKRYEELFAASPGMICIHDLAGYILDANVTGANAIGIPRHRLVGMNIGPFLLNNDRQVPQEYLERLARDGKATGLLTVQGSDGSIRRWKYRSRLFTDPEKGDRVVGSALDVTELEEAREALSRAKGELERAVGERTLALKEANRRLEMELDERARMEEELRQKHKLEALGRLAGGIAHEFNNILTVLSGNLEMALDDARTGAPALDSLKEVQWATNRAANLVSQILAFSRMDQATHSVFELRTLLEEVVATLRQSLPPEVEMTLHAGEDLGRLRGSPDHLRQVLTNLISNSRYALPREGGKIRIQANLCRATALESARVDMEEGTPCARIQISDNGRGIAHADQERVFDPFFTTREVGQGVGLGLSVAHGITRSHGGDITLESEPGRGTTVTLVFPSLPSEAPCDRKREADGPPPEETRILVVDDEAAIVRLVSQSLSKQGYQVTHFPDPHEALRYFQDNPDEVDLLLTDLTMPEMRGDELGKRVREIRPVFPILIMTGFGGFLDLATFSREGPTSILPKPFSGESLLHAVRGVLRDARRGWISSP